MAEFVQGPHDGLQWQSLSRAHMIVYLVDACQEEDCNCNALRSSWRRLDRTSGRLRSGVRRFKKKHPANSEGGGVAKEYSSSDES